METRASVLILDDDPSHLRTYGWIVQAAGYEPLLSLVNHKWIDFGETEANLVLLECHLAGKITALDAITAIRMRMPLAPIILLTDAMGLPDGIAALVDGSVAKGDPGKLVMTLQKFLHYSQG